MSTLLLQGPKKDLLDLIKRRGDLSVDEATEELNLAKTTIRQHLIAAEEQGLIQRQYRKQGPGRPQLVYRLSSQGQKLYPAHEPLILRNLIAHLVENGREEWLREFFESFWSKRKNQFLKILAESGRRDSVESRIAALRTLLEAEGFMPEISGGGKKPIIVRECNCPLSEAVRATQIPCKLESDFIRWALKIPTERTSYIPAGSSACTYSQQPRKRQNQ